MTNKVQLVCFDLGRVLIRICDGWDHACRVANVDMPPRAPDAAAAAALRELTSDSDCGRVDADGFARRAAPLMGLTPAQVQALSDAYLLGPYPGVEPLLDDLHTAGVATACLSNTNPNHWRLMNDPSSPAHLPLARLTHRFASFALGLKKPDPAIFEHVERASGARGDQIVFFDDLPENITVAAARGWRAVLVEDRADPVSAVRAALRNWGL